MTEELEKRIERIAIEWLHGEHINRANKNIDKFDYEAFAQEIMGEVEKDHKALSTKVRQQEWQPIEKLVDKTEEESLRDMFAAKAMQGMMLQGVPFIFVDGKKNPANIAYEIADMMLKARETKEAKT